jgi:hypothetical protein
MVPPAAVITQATNATGAIRTPRPIGVPGGGAVHSQITPSCLGGCRAGFGVRNGRPDSSEWGHIGNLDRHCLSVDPTGYFLVPGVQECCVTDAKVHPERLIAG